MSQQRRIDELQARLSAIRAEELELERELSALGSDQAPAPTSHLSNDEIRRYSRQLLLPEIGVAGQIKLRNASVLIVGSGGLGSPCALYLASMGVGCIGLVDHDAVDPSNLHRQLMHTEASARASTPKVVSGQCAIARIAGAHCRVRTHNTLLASGNAERIFSRYDVVVDASDNAATRYLVNDCCVLLDIPLVSGSAVRGDGQLTLYHYDGGPCYRCVFPDPPPPTALGNCSDVGVLGVVPGIVGCVQALEAVKVVVGLHARPYTPRMLLFSLCAEPGFRSVKIRPRNAACAVCGDSPTITRLVDYAAFCGAAPDDKPPVWELIPREQRVTCAEFSRRFGGAEGGRCVVLDVREKSQFDICHLPGSVSAPVDRLERLDEGRITRVVEAADGLPIYAVCRRGNLSQLAVRFIRDDLGYPNCFDLVGGLVAWQREVDADFPAY